MEMRAQTLAKECVGRTLVDAGGDKVGTIKAVYVDDQTSQPQWFAVGTGWFGNHVSFVPIQGTNLSGPDVFAPYTKNVVKDAPHVEPNGHLTPEEQRELYDYYGVGDNGQPTPLRRPAAAEPLPGDSDAELA